MLVSKNFSIFFSESISLVTNSPLKKRLYVVNGAGAFCAYFAVSNFIRFTSIPLEFAIFFKIGAYFSVCRH